MRKKRSLIFALILVFTLILVENSVATTWNVNASSSDVCTIGDPNCATIQAAIGNASNGDTINIVAGTYTETLFISKELSIIGDVTNRPVIDGGVKLENTVAISGLSFSNLYFKGTARIAPNEIIFWNANTAAINNFAMDNCVMDGENAFDANPTKHRLGITGNLFGQTFSITNTEFKDILGWAVMDIDSSTSAPYGGNELILNTVTFANNYIHDCNGMVNLRGNISTRTNIVNVYNNIFNNIGGNQGYQGYQGLALEVNSAEIANIYGNTITGVELGGYGEGQAIQLWNIGTLDLYDNTITDNYQGIFLYGGDGPTWNYGGPYVVPSGSIHDNTISNNSQYGISVQDTNTGSPLDASYNWWGDANPDWNSILTGDVVYNPWYVNSEMTFLNSPSSTSSLYDIIQFTDRLNFWESELHTMTVSNTGNETTLIYISLPAGVTYAGGTCPNITLTTIECAVPPLSSVTYQVNSDSNLEEYSLVPLVIYTNNTYTSNTLNLLKIKDDELFHTLVEYGRGRGNYFFDSFGEGFAGSGHTGTGCNYLPNGTMFELNFLHKVLNIKQYFGLANADAENVSFQCTYPDNTVIRQHLTSSIIRDGNQGLWYVDYAIPSIEGSWERMGYLGMDFDPGDYFVGNTVDVNCTNMKYSIPSAYGDIIVNEDYFSLEIRNREPFNVTAATFTGILGNGTQEVPISYIITNTEEYEVSDVIIEIQAPPYAQFIGTRGELWGAGESQYRIEKTSMAPGESVTVTLVARFDTSTAPDMNTIALSNDVSVQYITCWEINAYNPGKYTQFINMNSNNMTVDMGVNTTVVNIINYIVNINKTVTNIETTVNIINTTVENIWNLSLIINGTVYQINTTVNNIYNQTTLIYNDTQYIIDLLNCNTTIDSPICNLAWDINNTLYNLTKIVNNINKTVNYMNRSLYIMNESINQQFNWTYTYLNNMTVLIKNISFKMNCSDLPIGVWNSTNPNETICDAIGRIDINVNKTLNYVKDINITVRKVYQKLINLSIQCNESYNSIIYNLERMSEFDEELVFLVTDSFGLQQAARTDLTNGQFGSAQTKYESANSKLEQAALKMIEIQNNQATTTTTEITNLSQEAQGDYNWVILLFLGAALGGLLIYLFSVPR